MKLAAPLIIAAHVATLSTLTGWSAVTVYEGAATRRDDVRQWVTVGYVAGLDGPAVHSEPVSNAQGQTVDAGSILSELVVVAADVASARAAIFALLTSWAAWLATDRTLAGAVLGNSSARLAFDVKLTTTRNGATAAAVVTVAYDARTYG